MECGSAIAAQICGLVVLPIPRHVGYLVYSERNVEKLERKINDLQNSKEDLMHRVAAAKRNVESISIVVEEWLEKVEMEILAWNEAKLRNDRELWFAKQKTRYLLGRKAAKSKVIIDELLNEGRSFSDVSYPLLPSSSLEFIGTNRDFEVFASREFTKKQVMDALNDDETYIIGLHGMGGVGKTILMNQIGKQVKEEKLFDVVVLTTVSKTIDVKGIQGDIAKKLGLNRLDLEDDLVTRAMILSDRLKQERRILIVLDDLWSNDLDLSHLGIPSGNCCKVVITTRDLEACSSMTCYNIELKVLSEEESLHLFRNNAGEVTPTSETITRKLVAKCGGLPLAIVTLGRALRNKDIKVWDATLNNFDLIKGMDSVYSLIKLSYDFLDSEIVQKCFLFCSLFPEDHMITMDELMMFVIGDEQLFETVETLMEARSKLLIVMDKLVSSSLLSGYLEEGSSDYCVWMHDIIRDVAIGIASSRQEGNGGFFTKAGANLEHWPLKMPNCKHMSLIGNGISVLPYQPELPQLLTLSLEANKSLDKIPHSFFGSMENLTTLNLRRTGISSLPSSFSSLQNLVALDLDYCNFGLTNSDISVVGRLKRLEILSLASCRLKRLPQEMSGLINLKSLNVCDNLELCSIPPKVISNMSHLEELHMWHSFSKWEIEENVCGSNASLFEVVSLIDSLTAIHLQVDHPHMNFTISIGRRHRETLCDKVDLECTLRDASFPFCSSINVLLERVQSLQVSCCVGYRSMGDIFVGGIDKLKSLCLSGCNCMEYLMMGMTEDEPPFFSLEEVHLHHLDSLRMIFHGVQTVECTPKLRILHVEECNILVSIFPLNWTGQIFFQLREVKISNCQSLKDIFPLLHGGLPLLESLTVKECQSLEGIFNAGENRHMIFPNLRRMCFYSLPRLVTIWNGSIITTGSFPNLEELIIHRCHQMKHIFPSMGWVCGDGGLLNLRDLEIVDCSNIEELFHVEEGADENLYDDELLPRLRDLCICNLPKLKTITRGLITFQSLKTLKIGDCKIIKYVFPMRLLLQGGFMNLKELDIADCENLNMIVKGEDGDEDEEDIKRREQVLPQLKRLILANLLNLSTLYQQSQLASSILDLPTLEVISVRSCDNLKRLPFAQQNAIKLCRLIGNRKWFKSLEWEDDDIKSRLEFIFEPYSWYEDVTDTD